MPKEEVRFAKLDSVFPAHAEDDAMLSSALARLLVLYEDLRIEGLGIKNQPFVANGVSKEVERFYFLRRGIATLREFAEAIRLLETECAQYGDFRMNLPPSSREEWNAAARSLRRNEDWLRQFRNAVGGHFTLQASKRAIKRLASREEIGRICFSFDGKQVKGVFCDFAAEIAAAAMIESSTGANDEEKVGEALRQVSEGAEAATKLVHLFLGEHLVKRFGKG